MVSVSLARAEGARLCVRVWIGVCSYWPRSDRSLDVRSIHVVSLFHLISQAGWNRCNLSIYLSIFPGQ